MPFFSLSGLKTGLGYAGKSVYGGLFTIAETAADAFVLKTFIEYLTGIEEKDIVNAQTLASLAITGLAAIPVSITVTHYLSKKIKGGHHHHHHHDKEQHYLGEHKHEDEHHQHSIAQELGEFVIIGIPFGILTFGGSNYFLSKIIKNSIASYILSSLLGLVSTTGNWALHSAHLHAEEGVLELIKKISTQGKAIKAIMFSASIVLGHLLQGFLDGFLFLKGIDKDKYHPALTWSLSGVLALLITAFEAHTEVRSMLLNATKEDFDIKMYARILVLIASAIHALQPMLGLPEFVDAIYQPATHGQHTLVEAPLWSRLLLLGISAVLIGIPNGVGVYNTTVKASEKAFKKVGSLLGQCGIFKCSNAAKGETTSLLPGESDSDYSTDNGYGSNKY